jgi:hypothetical protein
VRVVFVVGEELIKVRDQCGFTALFKMQHRKILSCSLSSGKGVSPPLPISP